MAKGHKHLKKLKSEKAKVKLKTKKAKELPKGQNITDTSFKVKKISIREQLKQRAETEILSRRKLNVKDLLMRMQHHNSTVRQEAVKELKDIVSQHSTAVLSSQLSPLLQGISALSLDKSKDIRRDSFKVLNLILSPISKEQLAPFSDILISYLRCAMTHINPNIKEDSLLFLDVLVKNCGGILAKHSHRILPNFLEMISKLHRENKPGRQLTTTLDSKNTSVKWRIKVLERVVTMFASIVNYKKMQMVKASNNEARTIFASSCKYVPIYRSVQHQICDVDFGANNNTTENDFVETLDIEEFTKYVDILMSLMFSSWIEACPKEKGTSCSESILTNEALVLMKSIIEIIQLLTEYIEIIDCNMNTNMAAWFKNSCYPGYVKNLFSDFPYSKATEIDKLRKRQNDFTIEPMEKCLAENLALCQIYVWFSSVIAQNKVFDETSKKFCISIVEYLHDTIKHWNCSEVTTLQQLIKLLRTLLLKASKVWYLNGIDMEPVLRIIVNTCLYQPRKELHTQLFTIIGDIILDHTLIELHSENVFRKFVSSLPSLLLKPSIEDSTIQMINRVVLRYTEWIKEELISHHDAIIENAKSIKISNSEDEKRSRLMICNLFYFMDNQIYY